MPKIPVQLSTDLFVNNKYMYIMCAPNSIYYKYTYTIIFFDYHVNASDKCNRFLNRIFVVKNRIYDTTRRTCCWRSDSRWTSLRARFNLYTWLSFDHNFYYYYLYPRTFSKKKKQKQIISKHFVPRNCSTRTRPTDESSCVTYKFAIRAYHRCADKSKPAENGRDFLSR